MIAQLKRIWKSRHLAKAMRARREAYERAVDAERRGDDRDLGRARMMLQEATLAELRAAR